MKSATHRSPENLEPAAQPATLSDEQFLELIDKYRHEFYRYIHRTVWNDSDVDDVFSEAVLAAYRQLDRFEAGTNFRAWMYKILTNKAYVANRHTQRSSIDLETVKPERIAVNTGDVQDILENPAWSLEQVDDGLYDAVAKLRPAERACLMLRAVENCTYKEIANILSIPVGTVMTHLARGRAKARKHLDAPAPA